MLAKGYIDPDRTMKEWVATPDDRLCPVCRALDGQQVPVTGEFSPIPPAAEPDKPVRVRSPKPTEIPVPEEQMRSVVEAPTGAGLVPKTFDISGYAKNFDEITQEQRMAQANYQDISAQIIKDLGTVQTTPAKRVLVAGRLTEKSIDTIMQNARSEITASANYLAGDTTDLLHRYTNKTEQLIRKYKSEFKGTKAEDLDAIVTDSVQKLLFQEVESNRQSFTDHGIRHIVHNVESQLEILDVLEKNGAKITGKDRLLSVFAMTNHDVGYSNPLTREGGMRGIKATSEHQIYSEKIAAEQKALWDYGKVFSSSEYDKAVHLIRTHDDTVLDLADPLGLAMRVADNTALFHQEKLPSMFAYINGGKESLLALGRAAKDKNTEEFEKIRGDIKSSIQASNLGANLKRDLLSATDSMDMMTPKFAMGTLAGKISGIKSGGRDSLMKMTIQYNELDKLLQERFDMGQRQTKKLLEAYGVTDFSKKSYRLGDMGGGKALIDIEVQGLSAGRGGTKIPITPKDDEMKDVIHNFAGMIGGIGDKIREPAAGRLKYSSQYDLIQKEGRFYTPTERPKGVKAGKPKECYKNAAELAMAHPDKYTYVEGFATIKELPGYPFAHAWCVDKEGNVIDNTWKTPGASYIGLPFRTTFLQETIAKTRVWGLIPEIPTDKHNPIRDGFPEGAIYD